MTVEITLLPDGQSSIPAELADAGLVSLYLSDVDVPANAPIESWRQIERELPSDKSTMTLRVHGIMLSDVPDTLLTQAHEALTKQVSGVKPHPSGWVEYDESEQ